MKSIKPARVLYIGDLVTGVTGPVGDVYTATLADGGTVVEITDAVTAVLVGDFAYWLGNKVTNRPPNEVEWLHLTAAEYTKWITT